MPELSGDRAFTVDGSVPEVASDEEIARRVLAGDLPSFEIIMRRYNQRIYRVVRGILGDDDESEDVLQETYLRAYQFLDQFAGKSRFSTWLTKIGVHEALARRHRRSRTQLVDFDSPENLHVMPLNRTPGPEQAAIASELRTLLTQAVDSLPDELRDVFCLRMVEGLDTSESADCLELTEANVKVRLHRAKALLRARLDAQIGAETRKLYEFGGSRCDRVVRNIMLRLTAPN